MMEVEEESEKEVSLDGVNLQNGSFMVVDDDSQADKRSSLHVTDICSFEAYIKAFKSAENRTCKLKARGFGDAFKERCCGLLRSLRSFFIPDEGPVEDVWCEPFQPLS